MYRKHFQADPLCKPDKTLSTCGSTEMPLNGMVHLPVTYESETVKSFPFRVTETRWRLLGIDLFNRLGFTVTRNGTAIQSVDIITAFPTVFNGFGKIATFVHRPQVNSEVNHVSPGLRCLLHSLRVEVSRELKRLQDDSVIEPVNSSHWISYRVVA